MRRVGKLTETCCKMLDVICVWSRWFVRPAAAPADPTQCLVMALISWQTGCAWQIILTYCCVECLITCATSPLIWWTAAAETAVAMPRTEDAISRCCCCCYYCLPSAFGHVRKTFSSTRLQVASVMIVVCKQSHCDAHLYTAPQTKSTDS